MARADSSPVYDIAGADLASFDGRLLVLKVVSEIKEISSSDERHLAGSRSLFCGMKDTVFTSQK